MYRRTFLTATGVSLTTALAGCSDSSNPDTFSEPATATPTVTATETDMTTNTGTEVITAEALGLSRTELSGVFQSFQSADFYSAERRSITVDYQRIATSDH